MMDRKVILVTGINDDWGRRVAARLVEIPEFHVIGLDCDRPKQEIKDLDFIQADIRNPLIADLLRTEQVHTLVHLAFMDSTAPNEAAFDYNVIGTIKIFGACHQAGVQKIILPSSTAVYGAHATNSAFLREESPLKGDMCTGPVRDMVEIEAFCNGFRRQSPEIMVTILRFANIVGPTADTPMTKFLKEPYTPVLMGFDPIMQVIHENDVVDALVYAVVNDHPGVYNVAAEGTLPLRKLMALSGKMALPVFHLFAYWGKNLLQSVKPHLVNVTPIPLDYIRFPWVGDLTKMRDELGFIPHYTAEEALREFAGYQRMACYKPESATLAYDEERLRDTIERRRRAQDAATAPERNGNKQTEETTDVEGVGL
jgi:UDP-glucose 4-epimerase